MCECIYNPPQEQALKNKRKGTRNITWYNSPFNSNVRTKLGRKCLHIFDKCFPENHPIHNIFNRHTLKLSYSCMPNTRSAISSNKKYVLSNFNSPTQQPDTCNCRRKPDCPLEGKRLQTNVIYQANVTTATTTETFDGLEQTLRNVTEITSPPFYARTEEMKRNSQNIFGLYRTLTNLYR